MERQRLSKERHYRERTKITIQKVEISHNWFSFSHLFLLVLHLRFPSFCLSHCFYLTADCKQTHTNELWLNTERLQLAAKATDECCRTAEVTWKNETDCETNSLSSLVFSQCLLVCLSVCVSFLCVFYLNFSVFRGSDIKLKHFPNCLSDIKQYSSGLFAMNSRQIG